ncbi:hypothetical protein CBR_g30160 [Chara braunii]|uniref:Retrotransposon gag domain-containing protein n=1 Tax=Chara braunii TaxID=69332 RepID=A0A388LC41_CHABU|nr:hypothetical protein CBR_g30160 [Chara braunii]|eukprot:GBG79895.1 hypothetical protein CBR_g30160 [Chara braunii]
MGGRLVGRRVGDCRGGGGEMSWGGQRVQTFMDLAAAEQERIATAAAEQQTLAKEAAAEQQRLANEAAAEAQRLANEAAAEAQRLANEAAIQAQLQREADKAPQQQQRAASTQEQLWHHPQATYQQQQILKAATNDCRTFTTAINSAKTQQQQVNDALTIRLGTVEAQARAPAAEPSGSAAGQQWGPRVTAIESKAATTTQRIDHIIGLIGEVGQFETPTTLSSQVTALKAELDQLKSRPDSGKTYKMPKFDIAKFDDYHKTDALAWWTAFNTEADVHHVPPEQRLNALYLQLIGSRQAFMNNLAVQKACTIATLHNKITWEEFEQLWQTRFMVRNVRKAVMNELYHCNQGTMPTREWLTKWQKFVATPKFNLDLEDLRSEFFSRSCDGLTTTLGNELQYETFDAVISSTNILIQTDWQAANESRQQQPAYVAKPGFQRQNVNVILTGSQEDHTAAAAFDEGDVVAVIPPQRT